MASICPTVGPPGLFRSPSAICWRWARLALSSAANMSFSPIAAKITDWPATGPWALSLVEPQSRKPAPVGGPIRCACVPYPAVSIRDAGSDHRNYLSGDDCYGGLLSGILHAKGLE